MTTDHIERWLTKAVDFYHPRGYFSQVPGGPSEVVATLLPHIEAQQDDGELDLEELESPEFDLFFLSFDALRTLYESMDFGAGLGQGLKAYVDIVKALAKISRGVFAPTDIEESWEGKEGPIIITFLLKGKPRELKMDTWGGMFDFRILLQLNLLLWETPYRFEMAPLDDILFVTVLTAEEKTELERLRNLSFMVLDLPRHFLPLATLAPPLTLPEDPEQPVFFSGTLNENLDRCIGRLSFILRGDVMEGHHRYEGDSHQEDFAFTGTLNRSTSQLVGTLSGTITAGDEVREYEGAWRGRLAPGGRVATGTWEGNFSKEEEDRPDSQLVYKGQWGLLEEDFCRGGDPYVARTRAWLEMVWESRNLEDYPWLLPR